MTAKIVIGTMIFDSPSEPDSNDYGEFRTVTIGVPEGTPGAWYADKYDRWQIKYFINDLGGEEERFWESLERGDQVQLLVEESAKSKTGYTYKPIVPDDWDDSIRVDRPTPKESYGGDGRTPTASQAAKVADTMPPPSYRNQSLEWLDPEYRDAVVAAGSHIVTVIHQLINKAIGDHGYEPEQAQKIGVTAFIEAKGWVRKHGAGAVSAHSADADEEAIIRGIDANQLKKGPRPLLRAIAIACPYIENEAEAGKILQRFGLSRNDIDPDDPDTWVFLYSVARAYAYAVAEDGKSEDEATHMVSGIFNLSEDLF